MSQVGLASLCSILVIASIGVHAEEVPNGKDAFVKENAVNIPVGRILLARHNKEYCAVQFTSARWSEDESSARYKSYYIPDSTVSFADPKLKPREDKVYQKQPLSVVGRLAAARGQDKIFCKKMTLKWSGAPKESAWVYLDEHKTLELAPTKWRDLRDVNVTDTNLKWFKYGDATSTNGYVKVSVQ